MTKVISPKSYPSRGPHGGGESKIGGMLRMSGTESLFLTFPTLEDAIGGLTQAGTA
jgi:hypothetical protein